MSEQQFKALQIIADKFSAGANQVYFNDLSLHMSFRRGSKKVACEIMGGGTPARRMSVIYEMTEFIEITYEKFIETVNQILEKVR